MLNSKEILISKTLNSSYTSHDEFVLTNTALKEYDDMKEKRKNLKGVSSTFLIICFVCLKESFLETKKKVFYFTSKALFILEIMKF